MLKSTARPDGVIRPATEADLPAIADLCAAPSAFERAGAVPADLATRLSPFCSRRIREPGASWWTTETS